MAFAVIRKGKSKCGWLLRDFMTRLANDLNTLAYTPVARTLSHWPNSNCKGGWKIETSLGEGGRKQRSSWLGYNQWRWREVDEILLYPLLIISFRSPLYLCDSAMLDPSVQSNGTTNPSPSVPCLECLCFITLLVLWNWSPTHMAASPQSPLIPSSQ